MLQGVGNNLSFEMNGHHFLNYYLLVDDIYSMWTIFVQTSHDCWERKGSGLHNNKK